MVAVARAPVSLVMQPFLGSVCSLKLLAFWPSAPLGFPAWNLAVAHLGILDPWHDRGGMALVS